MRTEMTLAGLVQALQTNCGDLLGACRTVGVSLIFVRQWRKDDKEVNAQLAEAEQVGIQGLESAAIRRAVDGVQEDVYFKGLVVGEKTNYSDGLLQTLLKAKLPQYKADGESGVHVSVNIANVMPRAESYEQWLDMKRATLEQAKLPAPVEAVEYTDFAPVRSAFEGVKL